MKQIKLTTLKMLNFKGIENKEINFNNQSVNIYGTNETGKTTIVDAFFWCLFGKVSLGNSNFPIKPIDKISKKEVHNLLTVVETTLNIDGINYSFKRTFEEVYKTSRGKIEHEFSGHTSNYYINEVPSKASDYTNTIKNIIDEELFRAITDVNYFTSKHWKDQRKIIFSLAKNITDDDILNDNPELEKLKKLTELTKRSIADNYAISTNQNKEINKQLRDIPVAIRTLNKKEYNIPEETTVEQLVKDIKIKQEEIKNLNDTRFNVNNNEEVIKIKEEINTLKINLAEIEKNYLEDLRLQKEKFVKEEEIIINKIKGKTIEIANFKNEIDFNKNKIKTLKTNETLLLNEKQELYNKWDEINDREFTESHCAYCKQPLPVDRIQSLREEFNITKSTKLESITEKGKTINAKLKLFEGEYKTCNDNIENLEHEINIASDYIEATKKELNDLQNKTFENSKYIKNIETVNGWIKEKEESLLNIKDKIDSSKIDETIEKLNIQIDTLRETQTLINERERNNAEIKAYENELRKHQTQYEVNLKIIALCERFTAIKSTMLEQSINANFKYVEFKLFNDLINGGVEETCEATVNGVPYGAINHAAKINAGLDIINALQAIYKVSAPIFIDNAEAVVDFLNNDAQLIKLYVSAEDKKLRFEK